MKGLIPSAGRIAAIDGLRSVAVLGVLFFHLGDILPGGFFGVDVFLVISGFVVTKVLLSEYESGGQIRLARFVARRARRLLPALVLMLAATTVAAWLFLGAQSFRQYAGSLLATVFIGSNFYFWQTTDYFAPHIEEQPLLHTWSLGLEEQFYLLYPVVLLFFLRKLSRYRLIFVLVAGVLLSFSGSLIASSIAPVASFYLLPFRGWELLIGALIALANPRQSWTNRYAKSAPIFGLALIVLSFLIHPDGVNHPGPATLLPVLGTGLVIAFAGQSGPIQSLLGSRPFVFIGLISYSMYLWHLPVSFVLNELEFLRNPLLMTPLAVLLTIFIAVCSYLFVEQPRGKAQRGSSLFLAPVVLGSLGLASFGYFAWESDGFALSGHDAEIVDEVPLIKGDRGASVMVMGDSHGADLVAGLALIGVDEVLDRTSNGCIGLLGVDRYDSRFQPGGCLENNGNAFDDFFQNEELRTLIILNMGPVYLEDSVAGNREDPRQIGQHVIAVNDESLTNPYAVVEAGLKNTFASVSGFPGKRVIYVMDWPELGIADGCIGPQPKAIRVLGKVLIADNLAREATPPHDCYISKRDFRNRTMRYSDLVTRVARDFPGVYVFDMSKLFCDASKCSGYLEGVGFLYRDFDHLSNPGGMTFVANGMVTAFPEVFD